MRSQAVIALIVGALVSGGARAAEDDEAGDAAMGAEPKLVYVELKPTFVTNFGPADTPRLMYLKADVALRVRGAVGFSATEAHAPALRNELVLLLSQLDEGSVTTTEGREDVRLEALDALNRVMEREEGEQLVEDILFTNFIVQR
ncbi:MAG: flagellar basal body-associated FliL family protein [Pseudomonadota bacterium]